jgi:hypothetical protein
MCWVKNQFELILLALIPVWISLVTIIYCNVSIIYNFYKTTRGGLVVTLSPRTRCMIYRLAAIPIFALLVWLPATILRISDYSSVTFKYQQGLDYFWVCTFASSGLFNAVTYIFMDTSVLQAWAQAWSNLRLRDRVKTSTFDGPVSTYGTAPSFNTNMSSSDVKRSGYDTRDSTGSVCMTAIDRQTTIGFSNSSQATGRPSSLAVNAGDMEAQGAGRNSNFGINGINYRESWSTRPNTDRRDITTFNSVRESISVHESNTRTNSSNANSNSGRHSMWLFSAFAHSTTTATTGKDVSSSSGTSTTKSSSSASSTEDVSSSAKNISGSLARPSLSRWCMGISPSSLSVGVAKPSEQVSKKPVVAAAAAVTVENPILNSKNNALESKMDI